MAQALARHATALGDADSAVALWNYSSPLSASADVTLAVVHVGSAAADALLKDNADSYANVTDASDEAAVEKATTAAAGI